MTTTPPLAAVAQQVLDKLSNKSYDANFVSAVDLFRIGRILASLETTSDGDDDDCTFLAYTKLQHAYQQLVESLDSSCCESLFQDLCLGLQSVLTSEEDDINHASREAADALQAMEQLVTASPKAARVMAKSAVFIENISLILNQASHVPVRVIVFKLLASILPNMAADELLHTIQSLHPQEYETLWNDFVESQLLDWKESVLQVFHDDAAQQGYLRSLLFPVRPVKNKLLLATAAAFHPKAATNQKHATRTISPHDEIQRRIDLVRQVLPDLGEGFVEAVLSYYQADVERTVAVLLEDSSLPPALQHLDRHLPRMRKVQGNSKSANDMDHDDDETRAQALAKTKAMVQAANAQAERESLALEVVLSNDVDLYNDDYDDQWDNDHDYDAPNVGLYDADVNDKRQQQQQRDTAATDDYQSVLLYNKALKQVEADQQFWQENANTNISSNSRAAAANGLQAGEQKMFRGPDKTRGGRIPNAGRGGGRGRGGRGVGGRGSPPAAAAIDATPSAGGGGNNKGEPSKPDATGGGDNKAFSKRRKENQLAKRKDKQRQAMAKRSGA